jgi:hypothetical protein
LNHFFPDPDHLAESLYPIQKEADAQMFESLLKGLDFKEGFKVLNQFIRSREEVIPPLMNIYMHLSSSMRTFGTAKNPDFGGVEETGIMVTIADIYEDKKERHIAPLLEK